MLAVYNDLHEHPTDGRRLLRLLKMYEALAEPAESAAQHFRQVMADKPTRAAVTECMNDGIKGR